MSYIYWLNRRVERAVESYLKTIVPETIKVYRSSDLSERQFPCAVVRMSENRRFAGQMYAANRMMGSVIVMTEYARVVDDTAHVLEEFESVEEQAVSYVLEALYVDGLATLLNNQAIPGVNISYAMMGSDDPNPVTSVSEEEDNVSIVDIPLVIMAGATEVS